MKTLEIVKEKRNLITLRLGEETYETTKHFRQRMRERRVSIEDCIEALQKGVIRESDKEAKIVVEYRRLKIFLSPEENVNRLVTAFYSGNILKKAKARARRNGTTVREELKKLRFEEEPAI